MAWADTVTLCVMKGGVLNTYALSSFTALDVKDLQPLSPSVPIIIFAHIALWSVYPEW